jgi:hypothetical protein
MSDIQILIDAVGDLQDSVTNLTQEVDFAKNNLVDAVESAEQSASSASQSKDTATLKASEALNSANSATQSVQTATQAQGSASQSATNALASQQAAAQSEVNSLSSQNAAAQSAANALQSEQNALGSANSASSSAQTATTQSGIATTKANEASQSASTASTQAGIATTKASEASTSASNALTSRNEAEVFKNDAAASAVGAESDAIQLLRLHNPNFIFSGFVNTSTSTPSHGINKAYIATVNGTIFGISGVLKGQIIVSNGNRWIVEWPSNRTNNYPLLSVIENIFKELKSTPVATAYSTYVSTKNITSTFNGWRYRCNFIAPFRVAEFAIASSAANKRVVGYVWDENGRIVSTASVLTKLAGSTVYPVHFLFDKEITNELVGTKFWIGYRAEDFTTIIMDGTKGTSNTEGGLLDLTAFEQYSVTTNSRYDEWVNVTSLGSRLPYMRLYDSSAQNLASLIASNVSSEISSKGLEGIGELFAERFEYESFASQLIWTTQNGGSSYGDPFTGWGAIYNKVGISFNAIKIPALRRNTPVSAKKWVSIQLVVKNSPSSATILGLSPKIPLDPEANTVTNILLPLMDATLSSFVTLNDASFSGSTYFIGYCFYAADGSHAFGGTVIGTQSNYAGSSYYITNRTFEPNVPTSWTTFSGNPCIPMEHALLSNPEFVKHLIELDSTETRLLSLESQIGNSTVDISLPDKIYATVGDRLQLFYRGMIKAPNPYVYDILVSCSKGIQYPRYFEYLPVAGDVGTTTFKLEVKNKDGVVIGTKTCSLITRSVVKSPTTTQKVLCVGDSLTASGIWCIEASRRLVGSGGAPAGLGLSNIVFAGRKTSSGIGFEGTGGWTWSSYATAGSIAYRFILSGVTITPAIGSTYTNNGITYTVSSVDITAGVGYISATGSGAPTASGTLIKSSGVGDASLSFSSYIIDSANPFWNTGTNSLDFTQYVNTYMGGTCDVIYFLLTWNGQSPWRTDFSSMIATAKTLINHINSNYPNCKIKIMGIQVPSLNGGMGANYGATGTSYADTYGNIVTLLNMNKAYQDWCNEPSYSSFIEFVNVSSQFDSENNMPESDKAVNTRSSKTEKIGTNGVHPSNEGYYQIGDVVFRNFVANFCQ